VPLNGKCMANRNVRAIVIAILTVATAAIFAASAPRISAQSAPTTPPAVELRIAGDVSTPLVLTIADLKKMPRKSLSVVNPHDKKTEAYEGVLLEELLRRAGVAQGEKLRGTAMATYVAAEGSDGYRVIFSAAELDSGVIDSDVIVADTMDGAPIGAGVGPLRLVAPHEKRPARWVRMLTTITVVHPQK
jgi:DMSO/TMAO reductase YedYZ molybdopterin-dependent catalytic subunit